MLKILCVCGCGLGSSFAIEMTAKAVLKKLEIPAHIEHTTVSEAGAFKSDMILTQNLCRHLNCRCQRRRN